MNKVMRFGAAFAVAAAVASTVAPVATAQTPVEIQLMGWSSSESENIRLQEIVDNFNEANADVKVTLNQVPEYDTTLAKALAANEAPEVFYVDSFRFQDLLQAGALAPIGDKLTDTEDFYPSLAAAFTAEEQLYCPPKDFSTLALQINTKFLEEAGIEKAPTTWDELYEAAKAMTKGDRVGMVVPTDPARFIAFLYQAGGEMTDAEFTKMTINSEEGKAALEFYTKLLIDGVAKTPAQLGAGWPGEAFSKELAAMSFEGNWMVPFMADQAPTVEYTVAELPAGPSGTKATMAFTVCYGVAASATGDKQAAAIKFVDYITGAEGMKAWTDLGLAMPTRASLREGWLAEFEVQKAFLDGAEYARKWAFVPGWNAVNDKINEQIQQVVAGEITIEDALAAIESTGNSVLADAAK